MTCPTCQLDAAGNPRFCPHCGWALPAPPAPAGGAPPLQQARQAWERAVPWLRAVLVRAHDPRAGWLAAAVVLVVCLLVTLVAWWPLRWLPVLISKAISTVGPHNCGSLRGLGLSLCGAVLAVFGLSGSLVTLAAVWLLRIPLGRALRRAFSLLPPEARFLGTPVLATVLFTLGWAGIGFHFFSRPGLVPDGLFPAVVGLAAYLTARYEAWLRRVLVAPWAGRERLSRRARLGLAVLVPVLAAMVLTPVTSAPVRDQLAVLLSMLSTYILLAPRTGGLLPGGGQ